MFCFLDRISFCIVDLRARGVEIPVLFAEVKYQLLLLLGSLSLVDACVWEKCMQVLEQVGSAYSSVVKNTSICTDGSKLGWSGCLERRPGSSQHSSLPSWGLIPKGEEHWSFRLWRVPACIYSFIFLLTRNVNVFVQTRGVSEQMWIWTWCKNELCQISVPQIVSHYQQHSSQFTKSTSGQD